MAVKASPETIREMKKEISNTIREIQRISEAIRAALGATSNWNDSQAQQFKSLMVRIAQLTQAPVETLTASLPKLEKLAQSLDQYNSVKFGS